MRQHRALPVAVAALLAVAMALVGPSPAQAAPKPLGQMRMTETPCATATHPARSIDPRTVAGCRKVAAFRSKAATGGKTAALAGPNVVTSDAVATSSTDIMDYCTIEWNTWKYLRFDACMYKDDYYFEYTKSVNGAPPTVSGEYWYAMTYKITMAGEVTNYSVTATITPIYEWGDAEFSTRDVEAICAISCERYSENHIPNVPVMEPTESTALFNTGTRPAQYDWLYTGADVRVRVYTPGYQQNGQKTEPMATGRCDWMKVYKGCVFPIGDAVMHFNPAIYPDIVTHIATAQTAGYEGAVGHAPLHRLIDEALQDKNQRLACANKPGRPVGTQCDEYPFASTREGEALTGRHASTAWVDPWQNQSSGSRLNWDLYETQHVFDGEQFWVDVTSGPWYGVTPRNGGPVADRSGTGGGGNGSGGGNGVAPGTADLNGDNIADLLSQYNGDHLYAYPGSGGISPTVTSGTFGGPVTVGPWIDHRNYALGDITGDGRPDLVTQMSNGDMYAYPGSGSINGSTTFWSGTKIGNWVGHQNFALADLNGDHIADLITQYNGDNLYVYRGSGHINATTTFWSGIMIGSWAGHVNFALGDINGDHKPDLLTQYWNGDLYAYPGSGSVNATTTFWSGTNIGNWAGHDNFDLGDINGDGKADLLSHTANGTYYAYPGSGHINSTTTFWSGTQLDDATVLNYDLADLNGDGRADLLYQDLNWNLIAAPGTGQITATRTANTTFWSGTDVGGWAGHTNMTKADLNGDGIADLLSQAPNGDLWVYPGSGHINGTTTFWSGTDIGPWVGHTNLALGDLDGDHKADLLSQTADGHLHVYRGSGSINPTTTFWSGMDIGPWIGHDHLVLGDLNGDGRADLLTQYNGDHLYVYPGSGSINPTTTFWSGTDIGSWAGHVDFALGDINGDHIADLVSQYWNGDLYAYPGSGSINPTTTFWSGTRLGPWVGHTNITL